MNASTHRHADRSLVALKWLATGLVLLALVLILVTVLSACGRTTPAVAPPAPPTPSQKFLDLAHRDKLPANDDTMIAAAKDFCSGLPFPTGNDAQEYFDTLITDGGMTTPTDARNFEYDSATAFCPTKMNDLGGT
jgi:predicted small lipoprotein YifL